MTDIDSMFSKPASRRSLLKAGLAGAGLLGFSGLVSACSPAGGTPSASPTGAPPAGGSGVTGTVKHWDWYVSQEPWVKSEIELFQAAHSGVTVERTVTQTDAYPDLVSLSARSNDLPDVLMIPNTPDFSEQVKNGWFSDLNAYATDDWIKSFPPYSFVEGFNIYDGKLYTAPFAGRGPALLIFVNNQVFRDAGLVNADGSVQVPKTWDDVSNAASVINQKSNGSVYGLGCGNAAGITLFHWLSPFLFPAGSPGALDYYGQDLRTGRYSFSTDRNYLDWLTLQKEWMDKGFFHPDTLTWDDEMARANFAAGAFGIIVGGWWNILPWQNDHNFTDYSVVSLIGPEETPKGYWQATVGGKQMALSKDLKNPEAAWAWFDWWYSEDAGKRAVQDYLLGLSVHPAANDASGVSLAPFGEYVATASTAKVAPTPAVRNPECAKVARPAVTPSISDVITGIMTGQITDIKGALVALDDASNQAWDKAVEDAVAAGAKVTQEDWVFTDWDLTKDYVYQGIPEYPTL